LIEASNRELKDDNTALVLQLEETNAKLEETDAAWKLQVEETNARLQTTMRAVFGVSAITYLLFFLLIYSTHRIESQSTKFEIEYFWTWVETNWQSFVATKIGKLGKPAVTAEMQWSTSHQHS
jgi:hypothetical protein